MNIKKRSPFLAGTLSFLQPGLGQFYNGDIRKSILFFILPFGLLAVYYFSPLMKFSFGFYFTFLGAFFLRIISMVEASYIASKKSNYQLKKFNSLPIYLLILLGWGFLSSFLIDSLKDYSRYHSYKIPTRIMENTLLVGDFLIADNHYYRKNEVKHGDIVIFYPPNEPTSPWIQRVTAKEGDTIEIKRGRYFLNDVQTNFTIKKTRWTSPITDTTFSDPLIFKGKGNIDNFGPYVVPEDKVFLLGDNRDNSFDSRYFGFVDEDQIFGKPLYIWFSMDENLIPRTGRMMKILK